MELIVENGTGLPDADSYVSLQEFNAYCEARGLADLLELDDDQKRPAARTATEYADTYRRYKGRAQDRDQGLMFPRVDLVDWSDYPVEGVPKRLKSAVLYLMATVLQGEPLYEILDREIASESTGPISTSYVPGATRHREFTTVDKLLAQYVRTGDAVPQLDFRKPAMAPSFRVGMHDNPPGDA